MNTAPRVMARWLLLVGALVLAGAPITLMLLRLDWVLSVVFGVLLVVAYGVFYGSLSRSGGKGQPWALTSWLQGWFHGLKGLKGPKGEVLYRRGRAVPLRRQAEGLWERAAAKGHGLACFELGRLRLLEATTVSKEVAFPWFLRAAEKGHAESAYQVGEFLRWHPQRGPEARAWFELAARQGHRAAAGVLALMERASGTGADGLRRAEAWQRQANRPSEAPEALPACLAGEEGGYWGEVASFMRLELGHRMGDFWRGHFQKERAGLVFGVLAALTLVMLYLTGQLGPLLFLLFEIVAAWAVLWGLYTLMFPENRPSYRRVVRELAKLEALAKTGDPAANLELGLRFLRGDAALPPDPVRAHPWLHQAAQAGVVEAMILVADQYSWGRGVPKDPEAARRWLACAAAKGNEGAAKRLEHLAMEAKDTIEAG